MSAVALPERHDARSWTKKCKSGGLGHSLRAICPNPGDADSERLDCSRLAIQAGVDRKSISSAGSRRNGRRGCCFVRYYPAVSDAHSQPLDGVRRLRDRLQHLSCRGDAEVDALKCELGADKGQELSVDHIIPCAVCPDSITASPTSNCSRSALTSGRIPTSGSASVSWRKGFIRRAC
jgi:hypothetical protein